MNNSMQMYKNFIASMAVVLGGQAPIKKVHPKTASAKSRRSPELVEKLQARAEYKRSVKAGKRTADYQKCINNNPCLAS